ncbi:MAG: MFS transporter [Lachnospiraceae bacterium]|nr:MFS transporter [Lachnospiraceae bacterium]
MLTKIKTDYKHTIYASYTGYITQAIVNNFAPLLFLTFMSEYKLGLDRITLITTVNFAVQLAVDLLSARVVDKIGYRVSIIAAHIFAAAGLVGLSIFPEIASDPFTGIMTAVVLYAVGGGIIEVLISPIVESCPTEGKEAAMSLLHSFYCWGHLFLVIMSTVFFTLFGIENWHILAVIWALVPACNVFYFALVPLFPIVAEDQEAQPPGGLIKNKIFWLLFVLMLCAGASEQAMSQWASAFAERSLGLSKTLSDLAGPCMFAALMGTSRALYGKFADRLPLKKAIMGSSMMCILSYVLAILPGKPILNVIGCAMCGFSVGVFWPGTFSMSSLSIPGGGTAMFALLALAGDVGCSSGPSVVGFVANAMGGELKAGLIAAIIFPLIMLIGTSRLKPVKKKT